MKISILPLVFAASLFTPTVAAYKVYGSGNLTCGIWIESAKAKDDIHQELQSWVTGFVTGSGFMGPAVKKTDIDFMFHWIDKYCQKSPFDSVSEASAALIYALARKTQ